MNTPVPFLPTLRSSRSASLVRTAVSVDDDDDNVGARPVTIIVDPTIRGRSYSRSRSPSYTHGMNRSSSPVCRYRSWVPQHVPLVATPAIPPAPAKTMVDVLTYCYNKEMVYAPAGETYEAALDTAQELFPELKAVDRERISFHVTGTSHFVRIPKMAWETVLLDVPRYEVVHIQVQDLPAPPKYQGRRFALRETKDKESGGGLWGRVKRLLF